MTGWTLTALLAGESSSQRRAAAAFPNTVSEGGVAEKKWHVCVWLV